MRGKTGDICRTTGPYKCGSHEAAVLFVKRGDKFPPCPTSTSRDKRGHDAVWYLLSEG